MMRIAFGGGGLKVLNTFYDHIKDHYDVSVYQFLTMLEPPHPKLKADGWSFDAYGWRREGFRKHLMKYVVTGKLVIACIWGRNDPPFFEQVGVCKEFNIPMGFHFTGSYSLWKHSIDPDIVQSRQWLFEVADDAHKIDTSKLPLPSANHSTGSKIKVKRYKGNYAIWQGLKRSIRKDPSCVLYYTFEEGKGTTTANLATGKNNAIYKGVLEGEPTWTTGRFPFQESLEF